ncbi:hypothetical protein MSG28_009943 [Choristoneura fumiferana]|uniref:Uncharacterized protein n=1 Tax=Choristoneura fumiferana TaxID=7141 RepID=A0ACC0JD93_CHOFU|nr:hypothetical protein MSG28_009943 [Choristoneura fumiferana]
MPISIELKSLLLLQTLCAREHAARLDAAQAPRTRALRHRVQLALGRYRDSGYSSGRGRRGRGAGPPVGLRTASQPPLTRTIDPRGYDREESPVRYDRYGGYSRDHYEDDEEFPKISLPLKDLEAALKDLNEHQIKASKTELRSKSLPRPARPRSDYGPRRDYSDRRDYGERGYEDEAVGGAKERFEMHDLYDVDYENYKERKALEERETRRDRIDDYSYRDRDYDPEDDDYEFDSPRYRTWDRRAERCRSDYYERDRDDYGQERRANRRARSAVYDYERRERWDDEGRDVEAGGRARRLRRLNTTDDTVRPQPPHALIKPVPIWLCVFLVASYIVAGTFLFKRWEGWAYLDAAYFCFITLTTIGFGDFVPAQGTGGSPAEAVHSIALCSLYLLFGIALLAMSFNLVQEEVRANVAALATRLGIIKARDEDEDEY